MNVHVTNPLSDPRWDELVAHHPRASAFHQRGWLEALNRTYGYKPFVLTASAPGTPLCNGIVLCCVSSWLTGTRLVSLPFADHCEPLLNDFTDPTQFIRSLTEECDRRGYKYVELRPLFEVPELCHALGRSRSYFLHELDLTPSVEQLFRSLDKDSIQRKIRRAEREQLSYQVGRTEEVLDDFFRLLLITRRRHQLPPQPRVWFKHLVECLGDNIQIRLARKHKVSVAAVLTLRHRSCIIYKYGCSDDKFHSLGGMPFLFWKLIEESKALGAETLDLGRTDLDNKGLIAFKDRFGAGRRLITYYRYPSTERGTPGINHASQAIRTFLSILPDTVLTTVGKVFYRHMG